MKYENYYDVTCGCKNNDGSKKISKVWHGIRNNDKEKEMRRCPICGENRKIKNMYKRKIDKNKVVDEVII